MSSRSTLIFTSSLVPGLMFFSSLMLMGMVIPTDRPPTVLALVTYLSLSYS